MSSLDLFLEYKDCSTYVHTAYKQNEEKKKYMIISLKKIQQIMNSGKRF